MQHHYLTVNGGEQRDALAKVVRLFQPQMVAAPQREDQGEGAPSEGEGTKKAG